MNSWEQIKQQLESKLTREAFTVQTLAVTALFASGPTGIRNVANLRIKETDRLAALKEELFGQYRSVILTSATLATGGGSRPFDFVRKEVGLETGEDLVAESPFSWADSAE